MCLLPAWRAWIPPSLFPLLILSLSVFACFYPDGFVSPFFSSAHSAPSPFLLSSLHKDCPIFFFQGPVRCRNKGSEWVRKREWWREGTNGERENIWGQKCVCTAHVRRTQTCPCHRPQLSRPSLPTQYSLLYPSALRCQLPPLNSPFCSAISRRARACHQFTPVLAIFNITYPWTDSPTPLPSSFTNHMCYSSAPFCHGMSAPTAAEKSSEDAQVSTYLPTHLSKFCSSITYDPLYSVLIDKYTDQSWHYDNWQFRWMTLIISLSRYL